MWNWGGNKIRSVLTKFWKWLKSWKDCSRRHSSHYLQTLFSLSLCCRRTKYFSLSFSKRNQNNFPKKSDLYFIYNWMFSPHLVIEKNKVISQGCFAVMNTTSLPHLIFIETEQYLAPAFKIVERIKLQGCWQSNSWWINDLWWKQYREEGRMGEVER